MLASVVIGISVRRDPQDQRVVTATLRKGWWGGPGVGGRSRELGTACVIVEEATEAIAIPVMLRELALALEDLLA